MKREAATALKDAEVRGDIALVVVDAGKVERLRDRLRQRQSLALGIAAGAVTGAVGAFLWGSLVGITGLTYEVEWIPMIGIGFLVGMTVRWVGRGVDRSFAIAAAVIALVASLVGSFLTMAVAVTWQLHGVNNFYLFQYGDLGTWLRLYGSFTGWIDIACLTFTVWEAYALARFRLSRPQLAALTPRGAIPS
jgi:hypothetical protein